MLQLLRIYDIYQGMFTIEKQTQKILKRRSISIIGADHNYTLDKIICQDQIDHERQIKMDTNV